MGRVLLVRGARQLLTLRGPAEARRGTAMNDLGIIEDGAVLMRDGVIVSVGPSRRVENLREARHAEVIDAAGQVVMPGLVDSHTHFIVGRTRPGTCGGPLMAERGLTFIAPSAISGRRIELEARKRIHNLIRHGATSLEVKSGFALDESGELRLLRILAALRDDPLDVVPTFLIGAAWPAQPAEYLESLTARLLPLLRKRRLVRFVEVCCGGDRLSPDQARRCLLSARELGLRLKVHAPAGPAADAVSLAVELQATSLDGLTRLTADEIRLLAGSAVVVTLLPGAMLWSSQPYRLPARELIAAGAAVALASGCGAAGLTCGLPAVLSLACACLDLTPAEAVTATTINAAYALGLGSQLGSLEPEKQADLVIFDAPDYREIPYHFGVNLVSAVLKRGRLIYRRGEILWNED